MFKVVVDTNIIISAIHFGGQPAQIIKLAIEEKIKFFISREIITEILGVLQRKFAYGKAALKEVEELLLTTSSLVRPKQTVKIIKNKPPDNRILECALAAKADYLVSGDKKHLLPLKKFKSVKIITAQEFLKALKET